MPDFLPGELHVKEDKTNVTIHFFLGGELHCMNRPRDECMAKTLKRLSVTIKKKAGKNKTSGKAKKKVSDAVASTTSTETDPTDLITVHEHDLPIDVNVVLNEAWCTGMSVSVGTEHTFVVVKNAPAVISITVFPKHVLSVGNKPSPNPNLISHRIQSNATYNLFAHILRSLAVYRSDLCLTYTSNPSSKGNAVVPMVTAYPHICIYISSPLLLILPLSFTFL